jgi:hypothetical protein
MPHLLVNTLTTVTLHGDFGAACLSSIRVGESDRFDAGGEVRIWIGGELTMELALRIGEKKGALTFSGQYLVVAVQASRCELTESRSSS